MKKNHWQRWAEHAIELADRRGHLGLIPSLREIADSGVEPYHTLKAAVFFCTMVT